MSQFVISLLKRGLNSHKYFYVGTNYCQSNTPILSFSKNLKDAIIYETEEEALHTLHQININERLDPYTKDVYGDYYGIYRVEKYNPETKVVGELADFKNFENRSLQIL